GAGVEVVDEQATDAAGLLAVLQEEVLVASALHGGVAIFHGGARRRMPVLRILFVRVIGGQVVAAAEPPAGSVVGREGTYVQVAGRYVRVQRVGHDTHARGAKGATRELGVDGGGR